MFGLDEIVDIALKPVRDTVEVFGGLTQGEIREKALISLGTDVVAGMGTAEIIDWYKGTMI